jgi:hypothetical protein
MTADPRLVAILAACILVIPIYFKTRRFDKFWGVLLFTIGFGTLFYRLFLFSQYPFLSFFNKAYFSNSMLLLGIPYLLSLVFAIFKPVRKKWFEWFFRLALPYVFFGTLQQMFFLWIFTDAVYYLTSNMLITFAASTIYYFLFHLTWRSDIKKMLILLLTFGAINSYIYLYWGNILPQFLFHGLYGALLYSAFTNSDQIKNRIGKSLNR